MEGMRLLTDLEDRWAEFERIGAENFVDEWQYDQRCGRARHANNDCYLKSGHAGTFHAQLGRWQTEKVRGEVCYTWFEEKEEQ